MGELHLDIKVDNPAPHLQGRRQHRRAAGGYREKVSRAVEHEYTHKKQSGGSGQFAKIKFNLIPGEPGTGFVFESKIVGGAVPKEYIPGVERA